MTGVYADTSNMSDTAQIDAADVKTPIDALDTQIAKYRFAGGRLSLSSTLAVPTGDLTDATTLYYHAYKASPTPGIISLWDAAKSGLRIVDFTAATVSLSLSGLTISTLYDVFGYLAAGTLALEAHAWSSSAVGSSSRATALTWQNGLLCKSGDPTRRFLGTLYVGAVNKTDDTVAFRYLANAQNTIPRRLFQSESDASWTYDSGTWRESNAGSNSVYVVVPLDGTVVYASFVQVLGGSSIEASTGIALDSATDEPTYYGYRDASGVQTITTVLTAELGAGLHKLTTCESVSSGTVTFYGDNSEHALQGWVMA